MEILSSKNTDRGIKMNAKTSSEGRCRYLLGTYEKVIYIQEGTRVMGKKVDKPWPRTGGRKNGKEGDTHRHFRGWMVNDFQLCLLVVNHNRHGLLAVFLVWKNKRIKSDRFRWWNEFFREKLGSCIGIGRRCQTVFVLMWMLQYWALKKISTSSIFWIDCLFIETINFIRVLIFRAK